MLNLLPVHNYGTLLTIPEVPDWRNHCRYQSYHWLLSRGCAWRLYSKYQASDSVKHFIALYFYKTTNQSTCSAESYRLLLGKQVAQLWHGDRATQRDFKGAGHLEAKF